MKKYLTFTVLIILIIFYLYVANITLLPKSITLIQGEKIKLSTLCGINLNYNSSNNNDDVVVYDVIEVSSNVGQAKITDTR